MIVDLYASRLHYLEHQAPIWHLLPAELRGRVVVAPEILHEARDLIAEAEPGAGLAWADDRHAMCAAFVDEQRCPGRPVIFVEHGAGQAYSDHSTDPSYSGGRQRHRVRLFICPNAVVAKRWHDVYPDALVEVAGCPKLDPWHGSHARVRDQLPAASQMVVVSFHWDCPISPESRSAFEHWRDAVANLARRTDLPFRLRGHAHPRAPEVATFWASIGVPYLPRFADVLDHAALYVCDNSSTLFEFASTGRPVVLLNAPWYRRDVDHGLRFWSEADVGVQCDEPGELLGCIAVGLADPPAVARVRRAAVRRVYARMDGRAAQRAADAIVRLATADHPRSVAMAHEDPFTPHDAPSAPRRPAIDEASLREELTFLIRWHNVPLSPALRTAIAQMDGADLGGAIADVRRMAEADVDGMRQVLADHGLVDVHADTVGLEAGEEPPHGPADRVLAWVDGDVGRALRALAVEDDRPVPRQRLSAALRAVVDAANTPTI